MLKDINGTQLPILKLVINEYGNDEAVKINEFVERVRAKYWRALFSSNKFTGKLTSNLKEDYIKQLSKFKKYDFSLYNIYSLRCDIQRNILIGIEETILKLFEEFSNKYHYYDETSQNIHYYNGWKTNKAWIINKKVIIPLSLFDMYGRNTYHAEEKLRDMEKIFNYLDSKFNEKVSVQKIIQEAVSKGRNR